MANSLSISIFDGGLVAGALIGLVALLFIPLLRHLALPKPIPGIPHNKASARRILGDVPEMQKSQSVRGWMSNQFALHNSPIVQVFVSPIGKPWVLVSDFREARDVTTRRTDEFDKSSLISGSFYGAMPESHVTVKSTHPLFSRNRALIRDLMTPTFLKEVSAPEVYEKVLLLVDLWTLKAGHSGERPFKANKDISMTALDIAFAVAFDFPRSSTMIVKHIGHLERHLEGSSPAESCFTGQPDGEDQKKAVHFPSLPLDPDLDACVYLTESINVAFQSPLPKLAHWLYLQKPRSRRAWALKEALARRNVDMGLERMEDGKSDSRDTRSPRKMKCAVDQILLRERAFAEKNGLKPNYHRRAIYDELFGFIIGGHETTSTSLAWWVKYMTRHQTAQDRLRAALQASHSAAHASGRLPTAEEIAGAHVPYLEAVMEEVLRCSHIFPIIAREAVRDSRILGCAIPRGANVIFLTNGDSFVRPAFEIDEAERTEGERKARGMFGEWDAGDVGKFLPERWLKNKNKKDEEGENGEGEGEEEGGEVVFDMRAGPQMAFGAGPRGCFGRRLGYLELRIAITLLIWSFDFLGLEDKEKWGELGSFEAVEAATEEPRYCYVRLRQRRI